VLGIINGAFQMKTCTPSPAWDCGPFADAMDRALWELGYPNDFDTVADAQAAVDHAMRVYPQLLSLSIVMTEA
jgi:hypothetical protein